MAQLMPLLVGRQQGHPVCEKPVPLSPIGSLLKQVDEENRGETS